MTHDDLLGSQRLTRGGRRGRARRSGGSGVRGRTVILGVCQSQWQERQKSSLEEHGGVCSGGRFGKGDELLACRNAVDKRCFIGW